MAALLSHRQHSGCARKIKGCADVLPVHDAAASPAAAKCGGGRCGVAGAARGCSQHLDDQLSGMENAVSPPDTTDSRTQSEARRGAVTDGVADSVTEMLDEVKARLEKERRNP